jgi:hypothetical protein
MVKAGANGADGKRIVILGITEENVRRLRDGKPIHVHGDEVGAPDVTIFIMYGKDNKDVARQLEETGFRLPPDPPKQGPSS